MWRSEDDFLGSFLLLPCEFPGIKQVIKCRTCGGISLALIEAIDLVKVAVAGMTHRYQKELGEERVCLA